MKKCNQDLLLYFEPITLSNYNSTINTMNKMTYEW